MLCEGVSTFTSVCWRSHEIPYTMQWLLKSCVPNLNSYIWLFADHFHKKLKIYMKCVTFPFDQFFFNTNQRSKNLLKHSWYISFNLIYDNLFLAAASQESNFKSTINVEWVVYSDTFQLLKRFTPEPLQSFSFENELIVHYYFPTFIWYS